MPAINCSAGLAVVVVNSDVAVAEIVLRSWEDLSTTCDERCAVCTGLQVTKLVVLNKDATFRLQTSTGLLNLAVLHKDTTLRLLIFFQRVKIAQDGRHSLQLFQCWPLVVRFNRCPVTALIWRTSQSWSGRIVTDVALRQWFVR